MTQVSEVMKNNLEFCVAETRVPDIIYLMKKYNYHDIFVVDNKLIPIGIIHEDALSDERLQNVFHPFDVKAAECMEDISATIAKNLSIEEGLEILNKAHKGALPVVDTEGHICGMVSKEDLINASQVES